MEEQAEIKRGRKTHFKIKHRTRLLFKFSVEEESVRTIEARISYRESSRWIILIAIWQCDGQDQSKQDKEQRKNELTDYGLPEPHCVVYPLEEHCIELLEPQYDTSVVNCREKESYYCM